MNNYKIVIYIDGEGLVTLPNKQYSNEYELKKDIINIGVNGIIQKLYEKTPDEYFLYFPPHRINRIEVLPDKE